MRSTTRRVAFALAGVAAVCGGAFAVAPPASAATANLYERYKCGTVDVVGDTAWSTCDGTWANGSPTRSLRIRGTASTDGASFRTTHMQDVWSLDGRVYTLYWRCQYADNSLSGIVGTSHIGGSYGNHYAWGAGGYTPCYGTSVGLFASVYSDYGDKFVNSYNSRLQWNTNGAAGGSNTFGNQAGWPEQYAG